MKRSIAPIMLAAALIALPVRGFTQTPPQQPPAQPPAPQPPAPQPPAAPQPAEQGPASAAEHLSKARAALNEIQTASVTGKARTRLTELQRHVAALDRGVAAGPGAAKSTRAKAPATSWATDVAAIDRILTELTTPAASAADPAAVTGTAGTTGAAGQARAQAAVTVDDATRAKLLEVRTHITAFAAAMSGTAAPAAQEQDPSTAGASAKLDQEAARTHLTEARDILSQLTQLPEAAQLTGDARTQVTELITNFNELITTPTEWRASLAKVQANLTALVGAERTDEANEPPPATGTAGAVGTSGNATIDPKVREKLIAFRAKLSAFEKNVESKK